VPEALLIIPVSPYSFMRTMLIVNYGKKPLEFGTICALSNMTECRSCRANLRQSGIYTDLPEKPALQEFSKRLPVVRTDELSEPPRQIAASAIHTALHARKP
jgi:hypothetical protein